MEENEKHVEIWDDPNADRFCFADQMEFILYAKHCKENGNKNSIIWENSSRYNDCFMQGFHLYEDGKYEKALQTYRKALEVNPVSLNARFEICECYLKLGNLIGARSTLLEMREYLVEAKDIARFYRRMGYIAIEQKDFRLAAACLIYSMKFEKSDYVAQELMYIHSITGGIKSIGDPEKVIHSAKIPILQKFSLAEEK